MKIHILYDFEGGAWGGANQFLKALRKCFVENMCYVESPGDADVILFNGHHKLNSVMKLKKKYPNKIFVHRIGGIISIVRNCGTELDEDVFLINLNIADITIFQSEWNRQKCLELGYLTNVYEKVIHNGADPIIFYEKNKTRSPADRKIKLIATSWSSNWGKGFHLYKWLDETLDFDRYNFTFVGNSPVKFTNIRHVLPLSSAELSELLKKHDIFVTGVENDTCSNSLIEALQCGLPAVAINDGGNVEIIKNGGIAFDTKEECLAAIEIISKDYETYRRNICINTIEQVAFEYYNIMNKLYLNKTYQSKRVRRTLWYTHRKLRLIHSIKEAVRVYARLDTLKKLYNMVHERFNKSCKSDGVFNHENNYFNDIVTGNM